MVHTAWKAKFDCPSLLSTIIQDSISFSYAFLLCDFLFVRSGGNVVVDSLASLTFSHNVSVLIEDFPLTDSPAFDS